MAEAMTLAKWYGLSGVYIPNNYNSRQYNPFVASCLGIVRSIVRDDLGKDIRIQFREVSTAQADQDSRLITINRQFLMGHFLDGPRLEVQETITALLGIVVHESAHFAYSPPTLKPFSDYVRKGCGKSIPYSAQVAALLGNIIEDIYIESRVERDVPAVSWMLSRTNEIFFNEKKRDEVVGKAIAVTEAPNSVDDALAVINALLLAKTNDKIDINPFVNSLFEMARKATGKLSLAKRLDLTLSIYKALFAGVKMEEGPKPEPGSGEGEEGEEGGDEGEGADDDSGSDTEAAIREAKRLIEGVTAPHGSKKEPEPRGSRSLIETLMAEGTVFETLPDTFLGGGLTIVEEVPDCGYEYVRADKRYDRLAEIGRQRAVVNRPYGQDKERGTHIRRLHRIATDGKIFAEPIAMNNYRPMQVAILVDCSASMRYVSYDGTVRLRSAASAALGAANGLLNARCDVAVYGHTAQVYGNGDVVIYRFKGFSEPISVLNGRLSGLFNGLKTAENKDGHAIEKIASKFTAASKRRLLIVISDGQPLCPGYLGGAANKHTKDAVEAARKKGIDVLSISISKEAEGVNNYIYGEDNNVFNEDPNVLEEIVKSLLVK